MAITSVRQALANRRLTTLLLLLPIATAVRADDWTGFATTILGVPIGAIALLTYIAFALFRRLPAWLYAVAALLMIPFGWFVLWIADDTTSCLARESCKPAALLFLAFVVAALACFALVSWRFWRREPFRRLAGDAFVDPPVEHGLWVKSLALGSALLLVLLAVYFVSVMQSSDPVASTLILWMFVASATTLAASLIFVSVSSVVRRVRASGQKPRDGA